MSKITTKNRDFKGIWIPKEIWLSDKLTLQEKVFLVEIDSLDNDYWCYANNHYFSEFFWISKTRVSLIISSLVKKWFIKSIIKKEEWNKRYLRFVKEVFNKSLWGSQTKVKEGRKQKLIHNNTSNNINNNKETHIVWNWKFETTLNEFFEMREMISWKQINDWHKALLLRDLNSLTKDKVEKIKIIEKSIKKGWLWFFELKEWYKEKEKINPFVNLPTNTKTQTNFTM